MDVGVSDHCGNSTVHDDIAGMNGQPHEQSAPLQASHPNLIKTRMNRKAAITLDSNDTAGDGKWMPLQQSTNECFALSQIEGVDGVLSLPTSDIQDIYEADPIYPWTPSAKHAEEAHYDVAANAPVSELSGRGSNDSILGDDLHADITSSTHIASDQSSWHCRERCYSTQSNQVYAGLAGLAANEYGQVFYGGWLVANVDRAYTEHIAGCTIGEDGSVLEPNGRVAHAAVISIRDRYAVARRKAFLPLEGLPVLLDGSVRDANDVILGMLAEDSARELQGLRVEELGGLIDRGANLTGRVELYRSVEGSKPADHELEE